MPCEDRTGLAWNDSWGLTLRAGGRLATSRWADVAASARALGPCVVTAALAPWGSAARGAPARAAAATAPRCLLLMLFVSWIWAEAHSDEPLRGAGSSVIRDRV